jgi:hypothetical protein
MRASHHIAAHPTCACRASHAGLAGTDMTECSSNFIYILSQMAIKGSVTKV